MTCRLLPAPICACIFAALLPFPGANTNGRESNRRPLAEEELPFGNRPTKEEIRNWINNLPQEDRKQGIAAFYDQIGKPFLDKTRKQQEYKPPGIRDADTKEFVFKKTPQRGLKVFVDSPADWKPSDKRPAIIFWHGGGFTQGNAGQFYHQANYFTRRGAVCFRPEYRIRDVDNTLPVHAVEDGISAVRWIKERAGRFGIDPERVAVGGGSAGGCMASAVGTVDARKMAELGFVGNSDNQAIDIKTVAMILYNPFVDFFEPTSPRHIEEECLFLGKDPEDFREALHTVSGIENLTRQSPPSIILFGTKDAFYVQQLRWIVKCRQLGLTCRDYVYEGEVHSWYNNSPHLEYTTDNVNKFLLEIGFLDREPEVELPHKEISPGRTEIQQAKYSGKKDWDEMPKYQQYVKDHNIMLIPSKSLSENRLRRGGQAHFAPKTPQNESVPDGFRIGSKQYEQQPERPSKPLPGRLARQDQDEAGFVSLFNGTNLDGWQLRRAERKGFGVEDGLLVCPVGSGGYLFTEKEYADFVIRFEFRMEEGANSGLAIRCPLVDRKPAYQGIEIQILDNPRFAGKLRATQYHGSIYDVVPAKLGALRPVGQWNEQEVVCKGRQITVKVNRQIVMDVNLLDDVKDAAVLEKHPGLQRASGHIGFLGHGDRVEFRHVRIKDLGDSQERE